MNQESFPEKNLSFTESSSEHYSIYKVLDDLKDIDPWEGVEGFDKSLLDWSEKQAFGQTEFQNKYYVVNSQITPWRQLRQAIMEIQGRVNSLQKSTVQYKRNENDIARLQYEMEQEEDPFEKKDHEYQLEILQLDKQVWKNKIKQCKEELEGLLKDIKERTGTDNIEDVKKLFEDKEFVDREEHKYWIARMAKQSALDLLTTGRIQAGNLESMLMMSPQDQAAITDLALTYSTAMNKSIGKFKAIAEDKVDKMMEGRPPEMFDTAGVLNDYVSHTLEERKTLQSSNQPETES